MAEQKTNRGSYRHRSDTNGCMVLEPMSGTLRAVFQNAKIGFIYIVRCHDFVKIGRSSRPYDRISTMQTCSPYELELIALFVGSEAEEAEIHRRFAPHNHRAEWFRCEGKVAALVECLKGEEDPERARDTIGWWWEGHYQSGALLAPKRTHPPMEDIDR